jgi:hypothetical protein
MPGQCGTLLRVTFTEGLGCTEAPEPVPRHSPMRCDRNDKQLFTVVAIDQTEWEAFDQDAPRSIE